MCRKTDWNWERGKGGSLKWSLAERSANARWCEWRGARRGGARGGRKEKKNGEERRKKERTRIGGMEEKRTASG